MVHCIYLLGQKPGQALVPAEDLFHSVPCMDPSPVEGQCGRVTYTEAGRCGQPQVHRPSNIQAGAVTRTAHIPTGCYKGQGLYYRPLDNPP